MQRIGVIRQLCPAALDTWAYSCSARSRFCSSKGHGTDKYSENDEISPEFVNRNPRNLELLGLARKRQGWVLQYPSKEFYHRLMYEKTNRSIEAYVEHSSGQKVVSASSKENAINKHLYSMRDISAAENVGRVLARRCLESGITRMVIQLLPEEQNTDKFQALYKAMVEGGIDFTEPEVYQKPYEPGIDYDSLPDKEEKRKLGLSWV